MTKKKRVVWLSLLIILLVAGCADFWKQAANPDSTQNKVADKIGQVAEVMTENAPLFGPAAVPVALVSTAITALLGVYNNSKKKLTINGQNTIIAGQAQRQGNLTITLQSVVEAIDAIAKADAGPEGNAIKDEVKKKLQEHQAYQVGKAIISSLKKQ